MVWMRAVCHKLPAYVPLQEMQFFYVWIMSHFFRFGKYTRLKENNMETIDGYVDHIIFQNEENGYTVMSLMADDKELTAVGLCKGLAQGETIEAEGEYVEHPVYGQQFKISSYHTVAPKDSASMERYLGSSRNDSHTEPYRILIAHNPEYFEAYSEWGADLTVSGHIHGGIMRLPLLGGVISPRFTLFPKYSGGEYERDGHKMIVSCGLGTHSVHVRVFNPAELAVIDIKRKL